MHEPPPPYHIAKIIIDGRTVECTTTEERRVLLEAKAIGDDESAAKYLSIGRLMLIKDACQRYSLAKSRGTAKGQLPLPRE